MHTVQRLLSYFNPIPTHRRHLVPEYKTEAQNSMWRMAAPICWAGGGILLLFAWMDFLLYRQVLGPLLAVRACIVAICWLAAIVSIRYRGKVSIYGMGLIVSTALLLLLEVQILLSRDLTGPYVTALLAVMVVTAMLDWPIPWVIGSNLFAVVLYVALPLLLGAVEERPRFLFYSVALLGWAVLLILVHAVLTRIRWDSFLNRKHAADVAAENARLYEEIIQFSEGLEFKVQERTVELREAYDKLEQIDRNKSEFLHVVSHELRTPMTVFIGYSQMLLGDSTIQANAYLSQIADKIRSSAQELQEIVNTMLDVVKIDSGILEPAFQPLALSTIFQRLDQAFQPVVQERQIALRLVHMDSLPNIQADEELLFKVFHQLTTNAIKYTPNGGQITIAGRVLKKGKQDMPDGGVEIVVEDTGIGIDPKAHELIFTKFYQTGEVDLHSSGRTKCKGGGPGLGLAIARGIVEAHGGRIWVESPGYDEATFPGSKFYVVLPLQQAG
jgi:signal transduction histidine kinase